MHKVYNKIIFVAVKVSILALAIATSACGPQVNYDRPFLVQGPKGDQGPRGDSGEQGPVGPGGSSCTISQLVNGARISCTDGTEAVILNGTNGADGQNAPPTAYSVVEVIDPCGKQAAFDEVLLKLANGQIMAHFASGAQQFLALIGPGNYTTTDNTSCKFTITAEGTVTNEHN